MLIEDNFRLDNLLPFKNNNIKYFKLIRKIFFHYIIIYLLCVSRVCYFTSYIIDSSKA